MRHPVLQVLFLISIGLALVFGSLPWQSWQSPLNSLAMVRNPITNLTTLYPRFDKIVGRSLHTYGRYSPAELHLISRVEFLHSTVVEVGAHIGALSAKMSQAVGDQGVVVSIEPNPFFADIALANIALNSAARSIVLLSAASNVSGMTCLRNAALDKRQIADLTAHSVSRFFSIRGRTSGTDSVDGTHTGRSVVRAMPLIINLNVNAGGITIQEALAHNVRKCAEAGGIYSDTHQLDSLFKFASSLLERQPLAAPGSIKLPPLSLIRIDAEGLDGAVIQGAMGLINDHTPVVIFEAEYRDPDNVSHFAMWRRAMEEYTASVHHAA